MQESFKGKLKTYLKAQVEVNPNYFRGAYTAFRALINAGWGNDKLQKDLFNDSALKTYKKYLAKKGSKWDDARAHNLRKLQEIALECLEHHFSPDDDEAVKKLIKEHPTAKLGYKETIRYEVQKKFKDEIAVYLLGNKRLTLDSYINRLIGHEWYKDRCHPTEYTLRQWEKLLGLRDGLLTAKQNKKIIVTKQVETLRYNVEIPKTVSAEIENFLDWKQYDRLPMQDKRLAPRSAFAKRWVLYRGKGKWTETQAGVCTTRNNARKNLYVLCRYGLSNGFEIESLSDLLDEDLINYWINDIKIKSRGLVTAKEILSLLRQHSGWKRGYFSAYHFKTNTETPKTEVEEWVEFLDQHILNANDTSNNLKVGGKLHIDWFLSDSFDSIYKKHTAILDWMISEARKCSGKRKFRYYQVALWLYLGVRCPLRVRNFAMLRVTDNKSAYFDLETGKLWVHRDNIKNRKWLQKEGIQGCDRKISLPAWINEFIEHRENYTDTDLLFGTSESNLRKLVKEYTRTAINDLFKDGTEGWNSHAIRHIAASLLQRTHPNDLQALSTLLLDRPETVLDVYVRKDVKGNFTRLDKTINSMFDPE